MGETVNTKYPLLDEKLLGDSEVISAHNKSRGSQSAETVAAQYSEDAQYIQSDDYMLVPPLATGNAHNVEKYRKQAMIALQQTRDILEDPFYEIDPYEVLNTYAYGYGYYEIGCPIDASERKEQDTIAVYSATGAVSSSSLNIDIYDESLAVSCGQLQAMNMMILEDFDDIKWQGRDMPNKFYVGGGVGLNDLKRPVEPENYETQYYSGSLAVGLMHYYRIQALPDFIAKQAISAEMELGYIGGGDINLGSHRWSPFLWAGISQYFSPYVYLKPQVGAGAGFNYMDFGTGLPLELQTSGNLAVRGQLGITFDLNTESSFFVEAGYQGEVSAFGSPSYYNQGPVLRVGVTPNGNRIGE